MGPWQVAKGVLVLAGLFPLTRAWHANRSTSLSQTMLWALAAWLGWGVTLVVEPIGADGLDPLRYLALCLTGGAGVAVLGARRPYVFAWNFVVLGLLGVMLLPLGESVLLGTDPVDPLRIVFMAATIAVGTLNYLPTRFGPAALVLAAMCAGQLVWLFAPERLPGWVPVTLDVVLLALPWLAWLCGWRAYKERSAFDRLWLDFRDRIGLLWAQRVRDQFNAAAVNAGWPVVLRWSGLQPRDPDALNEAEMQRTLRATLKRFTLPEDGPV